MKLNKKDHKWLCGEGAKRNGKSHPAGSSQMPAQFLSLLDDSKQGNNTIRGILNMSMAGLQFGKRNRRNIDYRSGKWHI